MKKLLIAAVLSIAAVGIVVGAHEVGWSRATKAASTKADKQLSDLRAQHATDLANANQRNRVLEHDTTHQLAEQAAQHKKDLDHERALRQRFAADVRAGAVRLSVPIAGHPVCAAAATSDPGPAGRDGHTARAELAPEAAIDLVAIVDDGDDAIRQLNRCIAAYNTLKIQFNTASAGAAGHVQAP